MILVVDNYDSFTYNLVQYLGQCRAETKVVRNDDLSIDELANLRPDGIMLSPGPCTPNESGVCLDVVATALAGAGWAQVPIFGVCLGHQALGQVAGGEVVRAKTIMHGKASLVRHDGLGLFEGMPNPFRAIRYHSLVISPGSVPEEFVVSATSLDDSQVMGIRHRERAIEGVQFHPESVLTEEGFRIVENFVRWVERARLASV